MQRRVHLIAATILLLGFQPGANAKYRNPFFGGLDRFTDLTDRRLICPADREFHVTCRLAQPRIEGLSVTTSEIKFSSGTILDMTLTVPQRFASVRASLAKRFGPDKDPAELASASWPFHQSNEDAEEGFWIEPDPADARRTLVHVFFDDDEHSGTGCAEIPPHSPQLVC